MAPVSDTSLPPLLVPRRRRTVAAALRLVRVSTRARAATALPWSMSMMVLLATASTLRALCEKTRVAMLDAGADASKPVPVMAAAVSSRLTKPSRNMAQAPGAVKVRVRVTTCDVVSVVLGSHSLPDVSPT